MLKKSNIFILTRITKNEYFQIVYKKNYFNLFIICPKKSILLILRHLRSFMTLNPPKGYGPHLPQNGPHLPQISFFDFYYLKNNYIIYINLLWHHDS